MKYRNCDCYRWVLEPEPKGVDPQHVGLALLFMLDALFLGVMLGAVFGSAVLS